MCLANKENQLETKEENQHFSLTKGDRKPNPVISSFLSGSFSGTCNTILLQPLELIKTRIQNSPKSTIPEEFRQVVRSNGIWGLWHGVTPSLWRTVPGMGIYFACIETLTSLVSNNSEPLSSFQSSVVGTASRIIAGTLLLPFTVIKTRWEAGCEKYSGKGMLGTVNLILTKEGKSGLVAGLVPTLLRDAPYSGINYMLLNKFKLIAATNIESYHESDTLLTFLCALSAAIVTTIIVHPADVVKTSVQLNENRIPISKVVVGIYVESGLSGFMKGVTPRIVRKSIMSAFAWTIYEETKKYF